MQQNLEDLKFIVQNGQYETPRLEVIEIEIEGPILQMSGEDGIRQDW